MTHRCGAHVYSVYSGGLEDPSGGAHTCSGGPDAPTGGAHVCPGGPAMTHNRWSTSFCSGGLEGLSGGAHVLPRWSGCVPRVYQRLGDAHLRAVGKHIWVWPREGSSRRGRAPLLVATRPDHQTAFTSPTLPCAPPSRWPCPAKCRWRLPLPCGALLQCTAQPRPATSRTLPWPDPLHQAAVLSLPGAAPPPTLPPGGVPVYGAITV
eukprot:329843-Prymnesium_polylepis.1